MVQIGRNDARWVFRLDTAFDGGCAVFTGHFRDGKNHEGLHLQRDLTVADSTGGKVKTLLTAKKFSFTLELPATGSFRLKATW